MKIEVIQPPPPESQIQLTLTMSEAGRLAYVLQNHEIRDTNNVTLLKMLSDAGVKPEPCSTGSKYVYRIVDTV